jgi:hypothetical protein
LYFNRQLVDSATRSLRRRLPFPTMTTDALNDATDDSDQPKRMEPIQEDEDDEATVQGENMDEDGPEMTEKSKSHIIMRFNGNGKSNNVAFLVKEVFTWLQDLHPDLYLETTNPAWKNIKSLEDFPTRETDFIKCFDPTTVRGGNGAVLIGFHIVSETTIEMIKKSNQSFVQYLQTKKIGLKTSCGGSKNESTLFALLGFNPDRAHRHSILEQINRQLIQVQPDSAERRLMEKAKQRLPFSGIVPPLQLQVRWINAKSKKYSTKTFVVICDAAHADFLRSLLLRSYHEKHIIGLGRLFLLGSKTNDQLPGAITWNNKFIDESSVLTLVNISQSAMDQKFQRKATINAAETTTIRRILLSEGKATNITESRDIASGRWIVAIDKEKADHFTKLVAGTINKLYENDAIDKQFFLVDQEAPMVDNQRKTSFRRNSFDSAMSADDQSIQSMHSKAWSELATDDAGSAPKRMSSSKKPLFIFDPGSSEFPPLPTSNSSQRQDASSVGSTSTVTKTEFEQFQSKLSKDLAENLKECRSMASTSSMTSDTGTSQSFMDELRAERLQADKRAEAIRVENDARFERMMQANQAMMMSMQQMLQGMMPSTFHGQPPPFDPQHLMQPRPTQHSMQHDAQQQQQQQSQQQQRSQQQSLHPPPHLTSSPPRDDPAQYQHFDPDHNRPPPRQYKRPGHYFDLQQSQQQPPQRTPHPQTIPPGMVWNPYQGTLVQINHQSDDQQQPHFQHPQLPFQPQQIQYGEEHIEFDYSQAGYSQHLPDVPKTTPGGTGPTQQTPERKRGKPAAFNASREFYETAQQHTAASSTQNENSTGEGASGVQ